MISLATIMRANQVAHISNLPQMDIGSLQRSRRIYLGRLFGEPYIVIVINIMVTAQSIIYLNLIYIYSLKDKNMKQSVSGSRVSKIPTKQPIKPNKKSPHYLQLPNQQYLKRNLMLLGVNQPMFQKQTKCSLQSQLFPKHQVNPTSSKQFFYISFVCIEKLTNSDERAALQMWYPPRTVNQQLEYKKAFFKLIQNLEISGRLPKNMVVSKGTIMGDSSSDTLVEFLRFLSEMALRHQYLQKFSHNERLIQICCNSTTTVADQNVNKFYIHPFVPSATTTSFDHSGFDLNNLKEVYQNYLKIYFKKLIKLRTKNISPVLADLHHKLMKEYMEQKQLSQTLAQKIPKPILEQNRAFDRRRIIQKNQQIWAQLNKLQCNYVDEKQIPVVKVQGEVDAILQKWQPVKGISNILEANSVLKCVPRLTKQLASQMVNFKELCNKIQAQIKK